MNINEIREKIIDEIAQNRIIDSETLLNNIKLEKEDYKLFKIALNNLLKTNILALKNKKYCFTNSYCVGFLQTFKKDENYIFFKTKKYAVIKDDSIMYIHGDKVLFQIVDKHLQTVKIISIVKRKDIKISGTYVEYNGIGFVVPDNDKFNIDIYVQKGDIMPQPYERVLVNIDEYKIFGKPEGVIEKKLFSNIDKEETALEKIIYKYGIEKDFPSDVTKKAISVNSKIKTSMLENRVDLRNENIFTIDGITAKDFDDAISIRKIENGYELGVYIADVSYYVEEHGVIDKCASKRGNSYYLGDTVIPMLPFALSNGICSLNPNENRLCVGVKMIFDNSGALINKEFFEGIMYSKKRFTYEEINAYLKGTNPNFKTENPVLFDDLMDAGFPLAELLRKRRIDRGCIDFEFGELEFVKDNENKIVDFKIHERGPANKLIEEFMLITNETVASLFTGLNHPFIYRNHQVPFKEKIESFLAICKENNIDTSMIKPDDMNSKQFQLLLDSIKDPELKKCINMNLITCMKQAKYMNESDEHFGLASMAYCHFTSPIRRYADLYIHRLVKKYIRKTLNNDITRALYLKSSESTAKHCCYTERNADKAEEDLDKLETVNYFINNPDKEYTALIYSTSKNGVFILVNNIITGFIKMPNSETSDKKSEIVYKDTTYSIGDKFTVVFKEFDVKNNKIIFEIQGE